MISSRVVLTVLIGGCLSCAGQEASSGALQVRVAPSESIYVHQQNYNAQGARIAYDAMVHSLAVVNPTDATIAIESVSFKASRDGRVFLTQVVDAEEIEKVSGPLVEGMQGHFCTMMDMILWVDRVAPPQFQLSGQTDLQPNSALIMTNQLLSFSQLPDALRIIVRGRDAGGDPVQAETTLPVIAYENKTQYAFPLKGLWRMQAMPAGGVLNHHRFGIVNEFGIDLVRLGPDGRDYENQGRESTDYFGYGEVVMAAADGEVVATHNDAVAHWSRFNPAQGESSQDFQQRSLEDMHQALQGDVLPWIGGNYVLLEHSGGEHSWYFHLKEKSVRVRVGDKVRQGQPIAEVGNTGDSFTVHLHFQLTDGPGFLQARSLPFQFSDLEVPFFDTGWLVSGSK